MKTARQRLARWGESLAAEFLQQEGFEIIGRNVRTAYGEIDLVARIAADQSNNPSNINLPSPLTVFVEVKARTSTSFGFPESAITPSKQAHLLSSAQEYIRLHPELEGEWRVDVIAILRSSRSAPPEIRHFLNAVTADGPS